MNPFTSEEIENWIATYKQTVKENKPGTDTHRIASRLLKEFLQLKKLRGDGTSNPFGNSQDGISK
jgi:hypothetical protein